MMKRITDLHSLTPDPKYLKYSIIYMINLSTFRLLDLKVKGSRLTLSVTCA